MIKYATIKYCNFSFKEYYKWALLELMLKKVLLESPRLMDQKNSSGRVKKNLGQRLVGFLFTAGQK